MWKRVKRLRDSNLPKKSLLPDGQTGAAQASSTQTGESSGSHSSASRAASSSDFSLKSPLTRELALRVGQGQPASLLQQVAQAAVKESGVDHVSKSFLSLTVCFVFLFVADSEI